MRHPIVSFVALFACLLSASALYADTMSSNPAPTGSPMAVPVAKPLKFHCQWTRRFSQSIAWTGDMTIQDNAEGLIKGTYRSTSIRPDPFYGRIITVTGAINGKNIRLAFGISPSLTVLGELVNGGIRGTTPYNGGTLEFAAALAKSQ